MKFAFLFLLFLGNGFSLEIIKKYVPRDGSIAGTISLSTTGAITGTALTVHDLTANGDPGFYLTNDAQTWVLFNYGTASDIMMLHDATYNKQPLKVEPNTPTDLLYLDNNGTVGINVNTPARALHIGDVMRIQPRSAAPTSPSTGDFYVDDSDAICVYVNAGWYKITGVGTCS